MPESTHAIAQLPGLDIELVHDRSEDGKAERIAVRLTGRPDLQTAAHAVEPHMWRMLFSAHPLVALQADIMRAAWGPFIAMNPVLNAFLAPPRDRSY